MFPGMSTWAHFQSFAHHTYLFVDFFFILSGFVVSHVYGSTFTGGVAIKGYVNFMRARFARIYPLHFFVLMVYVGLAAFGLKQDIPNPDWSITAHLFLVQALGMFDKPTWNNPTWSISMEWWAYALFPFFITRFQKKMSGRAPLILLLGSLCGFTLLPIFLGSADVLIGPAAFARCLTGFLAGTALYSLLMKQSFSLPMGATSAVVLIAVIVAITVIPSPYCDIFAFIGFCLLIFATSKDQGTRSWLYHPALIWVGDISYSIYLWHTLLLHVFAKGIGLVKAHMQWPREWEAFYFICFLVLFEIGILIVAHLSYKYIEIPARNYLKSRNRGETYSATEAVS